MYEIEIYEDQFGYSELKEWLLKLKHRKDRGIKEARITLNQIQYCIERIKLDGTYAPKEIAKHLVDDIWELRPDKYRIMLFQAKEGRIILLNHFLKKTRKLLPTKLGKPYN